MRRPLAHHREQVQLGLEAAAHADHDDPAALGQRARGSSLRLGAPDQLEHDVEGAVVAEALGVDRRGSELLHPRPQGLVSDRGGHVRARGAPQLDRRRAHPAGPAVHQQPLARPQPGLGEEGVVGRHEHLGGPSGPRPVERLGHGHHARS